MKPRFIELGKSIANFPDGTAKACSRVTDREKMVVIVTFDDGSPSIEYPAMPADLIGQPLLAMVEAAGF